MYATFIRSPHQTWPYARSIHLQRWMKRIPVAWPNREMGMKNTKAIQMKMEKVKNANIGLGDGPEGKLTCSTREKVWVWTLRTSMKAGRALQCPQSQCTETSPKEGEKSGWEAVLWSPYVCGGRHTTGLIHMHSSSHTHTHNAHTCMHTHCIHTNILNVTRILLEIYNFITEKLYMGASEMIQQVKGACP